MLRDLLWKPIWSHWIESKTKTKATTNFLIILLIMHSTQH